MGKRHSRSERGQARLIPQLTQALNQRSVGSLASPTQSIDTSSTGEEASRLFRDEPAVNCLVMRHPTTGKLGILPKVGFYREMTGQFGYGYALFSKRPVGDIANWAPLVVKAADEVESVTALVLDRPAEMRRDDVVVIFPDGAIGAVSTTDLFEAVAGLYGHDMLHDGLTALPNRALLTDRVQVALDGLRRGGHAVVVMFIDLDDFKFINDTLGHAAGDEVLVSFARRVSSLMRPGDTLARLGGDEFALLLPEVSDPSDASLMASRVTSCMEAPFDVLGTDVRLAASLGIATASEPTTAVEILRNADLAMYEAKREHRGSFRLFEPEMHEQAVQRLQLEHDLKRAIAEDELVLVYQPQTDLDGDLLGFEALVRWNHPVHGELQPGRFIPLAEQSVLILELDQWVLRRACRDAGSWMLPLRVAVNVSARTLDSERFSQVVGEALLDGDLSPSRLEIEITETAAAGAASRAAATLSELRQWGVRIAIDDFGTGHSALSRLSAFPVDTVKIDRAFTAQLSSGPSGEAMVRAIIAISSALGLAVVAEGVETEAQMEFLRNNGCGGLQGFLLGRPMSSEAIVAVMDAQSARVREHTA
ncbi:MAG TPA: EAL domain-containing protein [Candidatus Solibacter sp.]|jgi:diguanylate cyclase (GGDEF)-like protein|nr:EAL domain-containing protein [Candidatus Solibacter sp.]